MRRPKCTTIIYNKNDFQILNKNPSTEQLFPSKAQWNENVQTCCKKVETKLRKLFTSLEKANKLKQPSHWITVIL